jgi:hypothetical protein
MKSFAVSSELHLVCQTLSKAPTTVKPVEVPTNHIVIIDVSGSMWNDLPRIREQLKRKFPKLIGEQDTLSIVWFSGRTQYGVLIEAEPVATLNDLQVVNKSVDRWLQPMGLTGFKEPLVEIPKLVSRIQKTRPNSVFSLFFMSDGCDNQWSRAEILKAVEDAAGLLASSTFVEYGYYADRPLLTAMAERAGGVLIFAEHFDKYAPTFEAAMLKRPSGAPRIEVTIQGRAVENFVYALADGELTTYLVENGRAHLPKDTSEFWFLSPSAEGTTACRSIQAISGTYGVNRDRSNDAEAGAALSAAYAAVSLYSVRMKPDVVLPLLRALGDVQFIESFATCFGKQMYSAFMDAAKAAAFDPSLQFLKGYDPKKVPADDAYTILEFLEILSSDENNRVFLFEHPAFKYSKIGRSRIDADEAMSEDDQEKIAELSAKMAKRGLKASELKELQEQLAALTAGKKEALKFVADPAPDGYSVSLVYNEDRPNISIKVIRQGVVDLSSRLPKEHDKVPVQFRTVQFRNYAVIKDGLVNIEELPVSVTPSTFHVLKKSMPAEAYTVESEVKGKPVTLVVNLRKLPVINRKMVKEVSAKALFQRQFELEEAKAAQKVYKGYRDEKVPKKESASFKLLYGEAAAEWLKEQGFTDYSGFSPKTVTVEATDFYMGKEMSVKIAGLSSLPKVVEVRAKVAAGKKLTTSVSLMAPYVAEVEAYLLSKPYKEADDPTKAFIAWVDEKAKKAIEVARKGICAIAQEKFAVIVGQCWFKEFSSLDQSSLTLPLGGSDLECKVEVREIQIKI